METPAVPSDNSRALSQLLDSMEQNAANLREKGTSFELLALDFLNHDRKYSGLFTKVESFIEWARRYPDLTPFQHDIGIDLVATINEPLDPKTDTPAGSGHNAQTSAAATNSRLNTNTAKTDTKTVKATPSKPAACDTDAAITPADTTAVTTDTTFNTGTSADAVTAADATAATASWNRRGKPRFAAIQCKFYAKKSVVSKRGIDSFLAASSSPWFVERYIIATNQSWSLNARKQFAAQTMPVIIIPRSELEASSIDWAQYLANHRIIQRRMELKPYQKKAMQDVLAGFMKHERGKLIMACGTGKTFTSLRIAEKQAGSHGLILFLVPSLALLSQTLSDWKRNSIKPINAFAVCSDARVGVAAKKESDIGILQVSDLNYPATTDALSLTKAVRQKHDHGNNGLTVIFSTYHSIDVIAQAQHKYGLPEFDLIICDEAHRTVCCYEQDRSCQPSHQSQPELLPDDDASHAATVIAARTAQAAAAAAAAAAVPADAVVSEHTAINRGFTSSRKRRSKVGIVDENASCFSFVNNGEYIRAKKRLYMTATPKVIRSKDPGDLFDTTEACSMDDERVYGPVFHVLNFAQAMDLGCLVDYKVIILAVDYNLLSQDDDLKAVSHKNSAKIIGAWKALNKYGILDDLTDDPAPMHRALGFAQIINQPLDLNKVSSRRFAEYFQAVVDEYLNQHHNSASARTVAAVVAPVADQVSAAVPDADASKITAAAAPDTDDVVPSAPGAMAPNPPDNKNPVLHTDRQNTSCPSADHDQEHLTHQTHQAHQNQSAVQNSSASVQDSDQVRVEAVNAEVIPPERHILHCSCKHIDGYMDSTQKSALLSWLKAEPEENECKILFNVHCLSEGVDIPALDAVIFFSPRANQVDVIQTVGRVMRKAPGKKRGYVIIPIVTNDPDQAESVFNLNKGYKTIWQVVNALQSINPDKVLVDPRLNKMDSRIQVVCVSDRVARNSNARHTEPHLDAGDEFDNPDIFDNADIADRNMQQNTGLYEDSLSDDATADDDLFTKTHRKSGSDAKSAYNSTLFSDEDSLLIEENIRAAMIKKLGNRKTWEMWAQDVAQICQDQVAAINAKLHGNHDNSNQELRLSFARFKAELSAATRVSLDDGELIEMLAQHVVVKPVLDELFRGFPFTEKNPIAHALSLMVESLNQSGLNLNSDRLQAFYASVALRMSNVTTLSERQSVIADLFNNFFKKAFPKQQEKLGIVYTPIEVVDFINHSVNDLLKREFALDLSAPAVHILDPFTGTGTFLARLLSDQSLITDEALERKYQQELHAYEIMPLAYYVASINMEAVYTERAGITPENYRPDNIVVLTDTFAATKSQVNMLLPDLVQNNERREQVERKTLRVIIGNPPYSVGQKSQNDNNQNDSYPELEQSIASTYVARTEKSKNPGSLYDSYIKAFRWASNQLKDYGIIAFVTNAGWLDSAAAGGMRRCLHEEFDSIYIWVKPKIKIY